MEEGGLVCRVWAGGRGERACRQREGEKTVSRCAVRCREERESKMIPVKDVDSSESSAIVLVERELRPKRPPTTMDAETEQLKQHIVHPTLLSCSLSPWADSLLHRSRASSPPSSGTARLTSHSTCTSGRPFVGWLATSAEPCSFLSFPALLFSFLHSGSGQN